MSDKAPHHQDAVAVAIGTTADLGGLPQSGQAIIGQFALKVAG